MQGLLDWTNYLKDWLYSQQWFSNLDYTLSRPSYDSAGLLLVIIVLITGIILVISLGKRRD